MCLVLAETYKLEIFCFFAKEGNKYQLISVHLKNRTHRAMILTQKTDSESNPSFFIERVPIQLYSCDHDQGLSQGLKKITSHNYLMFLKGHL